ncbi:conserved hypothetical protein [Vibrio phage 193E37-1]|nr:conserved hypothetical protein [Vibrio phage 193E37-1]
MIKHSSTPVKYDDRIDKEKLIDMIGKMVQLLQSREGDVDTVDGTYATVDSDELLHLEQEFECLFGVQVEDVTNLSRIRWLVSNLKCML